jgi:MFS family permease
MLVGVSQPSAGVFSTDYRALSVGILVLMTSIAVEGMGVATILPAAASDLGGLEWYGWAFSAFMLASLVGAIGSADVADQHSPGLAARIGIGLFAVGLVVAGVAPNWPLMLIGRALQGFGAGSLGTLAYLAIARGYPEALRPRLLALLSSAWIVPALVGPALAGQVAEHLSWRLVFIGTLVPVVAGAWLLVPSLSQLRTGPAADGHRQRLVSALQLALGIGLVLWAAGSGTLIVAMVVGVLGVVIAAPALRSLLPMGTFSAQPGLPAAVAIRGLLAFGFFGCEALIPLGLATERGLPPSLVGVALTTAALTWVAGSWFQDRAESRVGSTLSGRGRRVRIGLGLVVLGIAGVGAMILTATLPALLSGVVWAVAGLGMGLAYPGSTLVALGDRDGQSGIGAAALLVAETVGIAAGAGAAGALIALAVHVERDLADGLGWGFALTAVAVLLAFLPALRLMSGARNPISGLAAAEYQTPGARHTAG